MTVFTDKMAELKQMDFFTKVNLNWGKYNGNI